jgi:hypothetical protein
MQKLFNTIAIILSLTTALGVFIHDGRIDKAAVSLRASKHAITSLPVANSKNKSDLHTHPERTSRALSNFAYASPSIHPREHRSKRHLLQAIEPHGRHAFDNYYLPVIS